MHDKQRKTIGLVSILGLLAACTFFLGCPDDEILTCPTSQKEDCGPLQAINRDTGFILQLYPWETFPDPSTDSCRYEFMVFELETFFFNLPPGSIDTVKVRQECNCDFILIDVEFKNGIDLNNSGTASASKPKNQDDGSGGIIAAMDRNYKLNFGPVPDTSGFKVDSIYYFDGIEPNKGISIIGWNNVRSTDSIVVAIIDSGIDNFHGDIVNRPIGGSTDKESLVWFNPDERIEGGASSTLEVSLNDFNGLDAENGQKNCLVDDLFGFDYYGEDPYPYDRNGHGTHIGGIIASAADIPNVHPRLMPLKIGGYYMQDDGEEVFEVDLFAALCALEYAIDNGAQVINMSWGFYADSSNIHLEAMIQQAVDQNIIMVTSVGNDGVDIDMCTHWPSNYSTIFPDQVISVGALSEISTSSDPFQKALYSNYGNKVDVFAPGTGVLSAQAGASPVGTIRLNGTSMAAAVISRQVVINLAQGQISTQVKADLLQTQKTLTEFCYSGKCLDYPLDPSLDIFIRQ